jgi:hypothetical protein
MKAELYSIRSHDGGFVSIMGRPRGGEWLRGEMEGARLAGVDAIVSMLTPEESAELGLDDEAIVSMLTPEESAELGLDDEAGAAAEAGIEFVAVPITDRGVPKLDDSIRQVVSELRSAIASGSHVAVHCRMGMGRSPRRCSPRVPTTSMPCSVRCPTCAASRCPRCPNSAPG